MSKKAFEKLAVLCCSVNDHLAVCLALVVHDSELPVRRPFRDSKNSVVERPDELSVPHRNDGTFNQNRNHRVTVRWAGE